MDYTKKQLKEQKKKRKALNNSVHLMSNIQNPLNLQGVQIQNNVFFLESGVYAKVYLINSYNEFDDGLRREFVKIISTKTLYRVRFSSFIKRKDGVSNVMRFLTIYIEGIDYAEAYEELEHEYNSIVEPLMDIGIGLKDCSINTVFMYIYMNFYNEVKNFDIEKSMKQKENLSAMLFPVLLNVNGGFVRENPHMYGMAFWGGEYTDKSHDAKRILNGLNFDVQSCIEIQAMTDYEKNLFKDVIQNKYNYKNDLKEVKNVNMTFLISLQSNNETDVKAYANFLSNTMETVLYQEVERPGKIYSSICSLGLVDCHNARNVKETVVSGLFI